MMSGLYQVLGNVFVTAHLQGREGLPEACLRLLDVLLDLLLTCPEPDQFTSGQFSPNELMSLQIT